MGAMTQAFVGGVGDNNVRRHDDCAPRLRPSNNASEESVVIVVTLISPDCTCFAIACPDGPLLARPRHHADGYRLRRGRIAGSGATACNRQYPGLTGRSEHVEEDIGKANLREHRPRQRSRGARAPGGSVRADGGLHPTPCGILYHPYLCG